MNHITTVKMLKVGPRVETELFVEEELELELFGEGALQIIKTPDEQSFFVSPDEVRKLIAGLQKGLSKIAPSSGTISVRWLGRDLRAQHDAARPTKQYYSADHHPKQVDSVKPLAQRLRGGRLARSLSGGPPGVAGGSIWFSVPEDNNPGFEAAETLLSS